MHAMKGLNWLVMKEETKLSLSLSPSLSLNQMKVDSRDTGPSEEREKRYLCQMCLWEGWHADG